MVTSGTQRLQSACTNLVISSASEIENFQTVQGTVI